jgi:hypothetical protein
MTVIRTERDGLKGNTGRGDANGKGGKEAWIMKHTILFILQRTKLFAREGFWCDCVQKWDERRQPSNSENSSTPSHGFEARRSRISEEHFC